MKKRIQEIVERWKNRQECNNQIMQNEIAKAKAHIYGICAKEILDILKKESRKIRPEWDEYFMEMAILASSRSTCIRRQVGAVAVKDKRVLCTGYNGSPPNTKHCTEIGCLRDKLEIPSGTMHEKCRATHAEQNVIIQAALHGIPLNNSDIYCTHQPCSICMKMIAGAQPARLLYLNEYPDDETFYILKQLARKNETRKDNVTEWIFYNWS